VLHDSCIAEINLVTGRTCARDFCTPSYMDLKSTVSYKSWKRAILLTDSKLALLEIMI
jgi:hypothetical protein